MAVATWLQTNFTGQTNTAYKTAIDGDFAVGARLLDAFAVHERVTPIMKVDVDAGWVFSGTTLTTVAGQTSATIPIPANSQITLVLADRFTGIISTIQGTDSGSPSTPAITSGTVPLASVLVTSATTTITNAIITDLRAITGFGRGIVGELNIGTGLRNDGVGNLQANDPASTVSSNQVITSASHRTQFKNTSAINYTLPAISAVWIGFEIDVYASGGAGTLIPNGSDAIDGGATGASYTVPITANVKVYVSAAHQWDIRTQTSSGVTAGSYTLSSITVDKFGRVTAASSGSSSSGNFNNIANGTFSGSTQNFLSLAANGVYKLMLSQLKFSSGSTNRLGLLVSINNGSTFISSGTYDWWYNYNGNSLGVPGAGSQLDTQWFLTPAILAANPNSFEITFYNGSVLGSSIAASGTIIDSAARPYWLQTACYNVSSTINAIQLFSVGSVAFTGRYALYQLT